MFPTTPEEAVFYSIGVCVVGAVLTLLVSKSKSLAGWLSFLTTAVTGVLIAPRAVEVLSAGHDSLHEPLKLLDAGGYALRFYVDGLSAIFLLLAVVIGVLAALFSISHVCKVYQNKSAAGYYPFLLLFIGGMYGILATTDTMWFFFAFWQLMTIPSFLLVRYDSDKPGVTAGAVKYLLWMEAACAAAMFASKTLAVGPVHDAALKYDFDIIAEGLPELISSNPTTVSIGLGLFLIGFGIKVGMWPFGQLWIPDAYSSAPSPASSLISGVMSKTGVYGLMRTFFWLIPADAGDTYTTELAGWGMALAILGTITLFTGTMQGLKQDDSKRLLAYSSIGQLGYVILSIGVAVVLIPGDEKFIGFAVIAFFGALLHAINHGIFKGLLFFNAGSMTQATGTEDMNKMGGLWKYMPLTGLTVLIASFGIAGVPLLNGFVSKWSIYVAAIEGSHVAKYLSVCAIIAILTSAMTLAMYIKFFGVAFLSRRSAVVNEQASRQGGLEVGFTQQLPQLLLAAICVAIGLAPGVVYKILGQVLDASRQGVADKLAGASAGALSSGFVEGLSVSGSALYIPVVIGVVLAVAFLLVYVFSKQGGSVRRASAIWLCGYAQETDTDSYRYGASNFYGEIKRYFGWLGGNPRPQTRVKED